MSNWPFLEANRVQHPFAKDKSGGRFNGAFIFPIAGESRKIYTIASDGLGWQHVSVSFGPASQKTPSWEVMCAVKDLFWEPEHCAIQFHPPRSIYVNTHPGCLHLWRCTDPRYPQPLPDPILVG
jgi:hypothetical protein